MTALTEIGQIIEAKRIEKKLSIRALASICGISHSEVNKIEDGRRINPSALHLKEIAKALDIDQIQIMVMAGYIDSVEGKKYLPVALSNIEDLSIEELKTVQLFIDFIRTHNRKTKK